MEGVFVTFEGPDGAGKSTQIGLAEVYLRQKGYEVCVTREPGGAPLSEQIREVLLSRAYANMLPEVEVLLYAASRAQHVAEVIAPALERGQIVLCDRYVDASYAYQGYGHHLPLSWIEAVNRYALEKAMPDRTYIIDLSVEESRKRLSRRMQGPDRIEARDNEYHQRVRKAFAKLAEEDKNRILFLDGAVAEEVLSAKICQDLESILSQKWEF